ncbi:GAP family protein [Halobacteriales archaeon Cl-PHB]
MSFAQVLPLAVVMVAGPQILSAIFLATSNQWRRNSLAFLAGAAVSISAVVTAAFALGIGAVGAAGSRPVLGAVVLVALLLAMVHTYLTRNESEPPQWMGKLTAASPRFAFRLGFILMGFFPSDLLTSIAVGSYLASQNEPLVDALPFVLVTLLLLALPSLTLVVFGKRAEVFLPKFRTWMSDNAWVVNEVVILLFIALTLGNLTG